LQREYEAIQARLQGLYQEIQRDSFTAEVMTGQVVEIPLAKVVRAYRPNAMGPFDKVRHYLAKLWEFVSDEPREANTEGGVFPAIFGTVMMVLIMSVFVTPMGIVAAVYLREYAKQGPLTRLIRISVNNLAGVPSIVYGVFGLGFFVYFLGGNIDRLFFPEALPSPTFGTPGILWASLTLALLTLPVVIVSTEEGLSRIPKSLREGSLALGATKAGGEAGPLPAPGRQFPLPAPGSQIHAPGLPHLRRGLPEPQRGGGPPPGVRHCLPPGAGDRGPEPHRHPDPQPSARKISCPGKLI